MWIRHEDPVGETQWARDLASDEADCEASATAPGDAAPVRSDNGFDFFGRAHAQGFSASKQSPEAVAKLLQSDDPFVRRQARIELGSLGVQAEPTLQSLLDSRNYRQQIGAIESINAMKPEARNRLNEKTWRDVNAFTNSQDPALRESALRALSRR